MTHRTPARALPADGLLDAPELAAFLRIPLSTVRYWRVVGDGPPSFKAGRHVRYRVEDVERWIETQKKHDAMGTATTP